MLETMVTMILVIVGIVLFLFIVAYGIYLTFYPLGKTVGGGIEAAKKYAELKEKETVKVAEKEHDWIPVARLRLAHQEAYKKEG